MNKTDVLLMQSVSNEAVEYLKKEHETNKDYTEDLNKINDITNKLVSVIDKVFDFKATLEDMLDKVKDAPHTYNAAKIIYDNLSETLNDIN